MQRFIISLLSCLVLVACAPSREPQHTDGGDAGVINRGDAAEEDAGPRCAGCVPRCIQFPGGLGLVDCGSSPSCMGCLPSCGVDEDLYVDACTYRCNSTGEIPTTCAVATPPR